MQIKSVIVDELSKNQKWSEAMEEITGKAEAILGFFVNTVAYD